MPKWVLAPQESSVPSQLQHSGTGCSRVFVATVPESFEVFLPYMVLAPLYYRLRIHEFVPDTTLLPTQTHAKKDKEKLKQDMVSFLKSSKGDGDDGAARKVSPFHFPYSMDAATVHTSSLSLKRKCHLASNRNRARFWTGF